MGRRLRDLLETTAWLHGDRDRVTHSGWPKTTESVSREKRSVGAQWVPLLRQIQKRLILPPKAAPSVHAGTRGPGHCFTGFICNQESVGREAAPEACSHPEPTVEHPPTAEEGPRAAQ